jgi:hypothetical protein
MLMWWDELKGDVIVMLERFVFSGCFVVQFLEHWFEATVREISVDLGVCSV